MRHRVRIVLAMVLLVGCGAAGQAPVAQLAWGPVLSDLTPTTVRVACRTPGPADVTFVCDDREFPAQTVRETFHSAQLTGLTPWTAHRYRVAVVVGGQRSETAEYAFTTPAEATTDFTFAVYGDTRTNPADHQAVVNQMLKSSPALVLNSGDLVGNGTVEADWQAFFPVIAPLAASVPYYPCLGNHEKDADYYYDSFALPVGGGKQGKEWYSFRFGSAFFVVLDACREWETQAKWLDEQLTTARGDARWTFVMFHQPSFSSGAHGGDPNTGKHFVPVLERHRVNMVFSGHDHIYERSEKDGVVYIIAGGGGAPRYPVGVKPNPYSKAAQSTLHYCEVRVSPTTLRLRAVKPDGTVFDDVTVAAP